MVEAAVYASPLIVLSRADLLDLLHFAADEIVVPRPVAGELRRRGTDDPAARTLAEHSWLRVVESPPVPPVIQSWRLGPGESSVLAWTVAHPGSEAILDELRGRRCAESLNIPIRGTLGLVLAAKQRGSVTVARPLVELLRHCGLYLSDRTMNQALALVGE